MIQSFKSLSLDKIITIYTIILFLLIIWNILLKRKLKKARLKILILEDQKSRQNLNKLTKEFIKLSQEDQENKEEDDFEDWLENAEIGEVYHYKNKK